MLHELVGHEEARRALVRAREAGTLPSALLLHGPRGVGKQRLALWLGQLLVCESPTGSGPCSACRSCRMALRLEHPDLHWIMPLPRPRGVAADRLGDALEEARHQRLAELRERPLQASVGDPDPTGIYLAAAQTLRRRAHRRPSMAREQLFIVADAELLVPQESSPEAANALLKVLEEPPEDTRLVLTSSEPGSLLDTIRSRTVPLHVGPLDEDRLAAFLVEAVGAEPSLARAAARRAGGAIGRALGFVPLDDGSPGPLEELHLEAWRVLKAAVSDGPGAGMALAMGLGPTRARGLLELLAAVETWLRDLAAVAAGASERAVARDAVPELEALVRSTGVRAEAVARALPVVDEAAQQARGNVNPQLIMAGMVSGLRARLRPT
jgi:DNA polymerase-3 subunit delta'